MFTGRRPTDEKLKDGLSLHSFVKGALPGRVGEIIDPNLVQERARGGTITNNGGSENSLVRSKKHLQYLNSIIEIGVNCSAESPSERMDMSDVVTKLCSIKDKFQPGQTLNAARSGR